MATAAHYDNHSQEKWAQLCYHISQAARMAVQTFRKKYHISTSLEGA